MTTSGDNPTFFYQGKVENEKKKLGVINFLTKTLMDNNWICITHKLGFSCTITMIIWINACLEMPSCEETSNWPIN